MKIKKYKVKLNENKVNILVEDETFDCKTDFNEVISPNRIEKVMNEIFDMKNLAEEYLYLIALNSKSKILGIFEVSHGSVNSSICNPREVFISALLCGAVGFVLVHNHPSGDPTPSTCDRQITKRLCEAGKLLQVKMLDHIIIGDNYFSFNDHDLLC